MLGLISEACNGYSLMDVILVAIPEYMLHGLSMSTYAELMPDFSPPEVKAQQQQQHNTGIFLNVDPQAVNYYSRKMHPCVPVKP